MGHLHFWVYDKIASMLLRKVLLERDILKHRPSVIKGPYLHILSQQFTLDLFIEVVNAYCNLADKKTSYLVWVQPYLAKIKTKYIGHFSGVDTVGLVESKVHMGTQVEKALARRLFYLYECRNVEKIWN